MVVNLCCVSCIACLVGWLIVSWKAAPFLVPHVGFLIVMAVALWLLINWSKLKHRGVQQNRVCRFIANVGLVDRTKQEADLGLTEKKQD